MKQIEECLERFYQGKPPLQSKKWKAFPAENRYLYLFHYHHMVLIYDFYDRKVLHAWAELPADKRGLSAAMNYIVSVYPERTPVGFERLTP